MSVRERQVLELLATGATDQQIAERLFITIRTVRSHLDRIRDKTGCRRRGELARLAVELAQQEAAASVGAQLASPGTSGRSSNLPRLVSTFVGRGVEVTDVRRLVEQSRLVTLTGPGGAGKTRLALEVAGELLDGSGEGVWFVELAAIDGPERVAGAVASALGIKAQPGRPDHEVVVDVLSDQSTLIVLDNCEHVIAACAKLADAILRSCPQVHLLVTSREALDIDGERVFATPPLSLPPLEVETVADVADSEAVALLVERTRAHTTGFTLDDESAVLAADLCRRLDGLPLGIELAAARLRSMSLAEVRDRLDQRFRLLTGGSRTALARQQTLLATVAWSYELLTAAEQRVLRRLSVFVADFDLDAAEAVAASDEGDAFEVADLVRSMVDKSLLVADTSSGSLRCRMLETIRQYAADRLSGDPGSEVEQLREAHARYYLGLVEQAAPHLHGPVQEMWLARLELSYPNLRVAIEHFLSTMDGAPQALRLFGASRAFWWATATHDNDALDLLDKALDASSANAVDLPPVLRAAAVLCKAYVLFSRDLDAQAECAREAAALAHRADNPALEAEALGFLASNSAFRGVPVEGVEPSREAVAIARQLQDPVVLTQALLCGAAPMVLLDSSTAEALYREGLELAHLSGDSYAAAFLHGDLANLLLHDDRLEEAREHLHAVLTTADIAETRVGEFALGNMGWVLLADDDTSGASVNFTDLLRRARRTGDLNLASFATLGLACCSVQQGDLQRAASLHGAADALRTALGVAEWISPEQKYRDLALARVRAELGSDFTGLYDTGRSMTRAEVMDLALRPPAKGAG